MAFVIGVGLGILVGVALGANRARQKKMRQTRAALKEGRFSIVANDGAALDAEGLMVVLDDEFRDA